MSCSVTSERSCVVWISLPGGAGPVPCGALTVDQTGRNTNAEFTYGPRYLARADAISLDPIHLPLRAASFKADHLFCAIRDAAPDRWGRKVLELRHAALKYNEFGELPELEYLLKSAGDRVGALAFTEDASAPPTLPTRISMSGLADAIHAVETGRAVTQAQGALLTGSLGGARPKSAYQDAKASMILKFGRQDDRFDQVRVEKAMLDMAAACGFDVPEREFVEVDGTTALGIHRFDRERIKGQHYPRHYLSAKTLLGQYGETEIGSYPAFADELRRWSDQPARDCHELFGRMLFNIATGNCDDHAKNHGVLHAGGTTYRLAPAFDLVPMPQVSTTWRQAMIVGLRGQDSDFANALTVVQHFMLEADAGKAIARRVGKTVSAWRKFFASARVSKRDTEYVQACFDVGRLAVSPFRSLSNRNR